MHHGTVTYDPDLLDIEDIKDMDRLATNRQVDCRDAYKPTRGDDIGRLQRVINHAERVRNMYDPNDLYMNVGIDPLVKPFRYLNTMAGRAGWTVKYWDRSNRRGKFPKQYKAEYIPPAKGMEKIIVHYNAEDRTNYDLFEDHIIEFLDMNKKLMDSTVEIQ